MDGQEIESAIISWIGTFVEADIGEISIEKLFDGHILTEILSKIDPDYFRFSSSKTSIKDIYEKLAKYYQEVIDKRFDKDAIVIDKLVSGRDPQQMLNLVEMVLGAAMSCRYKEIFISAILSLDDSHQTTLMYLIEKFMARQAVATESAEPAEMKESRTVRIQNEEYNKKMELLLKLQELEKDNNALSDMNNNLNMERVKFLKRLEELEQELTKKNHEVKRLTERKEDAAENEKLEELRLEISYKDKKLAEQSKLIEEIKSQHDLSFNKLKEENTELKRKSGQITKLEGNLEFYKQKYEEYLRTANRLAEVMSQAENQDSRIKDLVQMKENLLAKLEKYKVQIAEEKNNALNLELDISRKNAELDILRSERTKLEKLLTEQEARLSDANQSVQQFSIQKEEYKQSEAAASQEQTESSKAEIPKGVDLTEVLGNIEKEIELYRLDIDPNKTAEEAQIELLEKENQLLREKLKEVFTQGGDLKGSLDPQSAQLVEKLTLENERAKADLVRVIASMDTSPSLELKKLRTENAHTKERLLIVERQLAELKVVQDELVHIDKLKAAEEENHKKGIKIDQLSSKLNEAEQKLRVFDEDCNKKLVELDYLQKANNNLNSILDGLADQKDEELQVLASAMHELILRNQELETTVASLIKNPKPFEKMKLSKEPGPAKSLYEATKA